MGGMFKSPPKPDPAPPPPERSDTEVQAQAEKDRRKAYGGSQSQTFFTGGKGAGSVSSAATKFLGGATAGM